MQALECLAHRDRETYDEFIARVRTNAIASRVKLADLEDNMDMRRLRTLTEKDTERLHKYPPGLVSLTPGWGRCQVEPRNLMVQITPVPRIAMIVFLIHTSF